MEESHTENNKQTIFVSVVILTILVMTLFYFLYLPNKQTPAEDTAGEPENSQTSTESAVPPSANPLLLTTPEATPVEKTNPFKYENPFE